MLKPETGFIKVAGGRVFFRAYLSSSTTAYPLVVIHGGPGFSHNPLLAIAPMATERDIIFYDQLGCGQSDRPTDHELWTLERSVAELETVISYFNLKKHHVLGHSFGGTLALQYGLTLPSGLRGLVLSSPLLSVKDWLADTDIRKKELPNSIQDIIEEHEAANTTDNLAYQEAVKEFNCRYVCLLDPKPEVYKNAVKQFNKVVYEAMWGPSEFSCTGNLSSYDGASQLSELKIPGLLLCGDQDEVLPATLQRYLEKMLAASELYVLPHCSHASYLEASELYIQVVQQFLSTIEKGISDNIEHSCSV